MEENEIKLWLRCNGNMEIFRNERTLAEKLWKL